MAFLCGLANLAEARFRSQSLRSFFALISPSCRNASLYWFVCDVSAMGPMLNRGNVLQFAGLALGGALTVAWVAFLAYALHWAIDYFGM